MIDKYIKFEDWDDLGDWMLHFYNVEVIKDIGPLKIGDKYDGITFDVQYGIIRANNIDDKNKIEEDGYSAPVVVVHEFKIDIIPAE